MKCLAIGFRLISVKRGQGFIYETVCTIIENKMLKRREMGRLLSVSDARLVNEIVFRPKFFLSISKILKNVLGRLLYFAMIELKFEGILVH